MGTSKPQQKRAAAENRKRRGAQRRLEQDSNTRDRAARPSLDQTGEHQPPRPPLHTPHTNAKTREATHNARTTKATRTPTDIPQTNPSGNANLLNPSRDITPIWGGGGGEPKTHEPTEAWIHKPHKPRATSKGAGGCGGRQSSHRGPGGAAPLEAKDAHEGGRETITTTSQANRRSCRVTVTRKNQETQTSTDGLEIPSDYRTKLGHGTTTHALPPQSRMAHTPGPGPLQEGQSAPPSKHREPRTHPPQNETNNHSHQGS
uniref:Uncharacterized protein n=1 Tax=Knipowitschia caucasica TaxID=637954 RepID=A0AAV2LR75_KNICA